MTQDPFTQDSSKAEPPSAERLGPSPAYYALLDLPATATLEQIRKAYRLKSKLYHPDTTLLPAEVAIEKFRDLNHAYAILSNAQQRAWYDKYSRGESSDLPTPTAKPPRASGPVPGGALDPTERPLSAGEVFALFLLVITFVVCLVIAIILGVSRGEMVLQSARTMPPAEIAGAVSSHLLPGSTRDQSGRKVPELPSSPVKRSVTSKDSVSLKKSVELKQQPLGAQAKTRKS